MSTFYKTNLFLQGAPLPQGFRGTPQAMYEAMIERLRIVSPLGIGTFVVGSLKPSSNQGPWLKDGTQWYVWDENEADYVPLDITASETPPYFVQAADPAGTPDPEGNYLAVPDGGPEGGPLDGGPLLWFRLDESLTLITGVFLFLNGRWQAVLRNSGTTANRPTNPANLEDYYDTTISTMIHFERGQWRTLDGSRGDLKYVSWPTAEQALQYNPGWEIFGTGESDSTVLHGRLLVQATKNPGGGSTTTLAVTGGVKERTAGESSGEEEHALTIDEMPAHTHTSHDTTHNQTPDSTDFTASEYGEYHVAQTGSAGGSQAHNNLPPVYACWCLRKT